MAKGDADLAQRVTDMLAVSTETFDERVEEDAKALVEAIEEGAFDNLQSTVGLEYEFYCVDDSGALARVPRRTLELPGIEKELGLHNVELNTSPQPFTEHGLAAQEMEVRARLEAVQRVMAAEGRRLVSDSLWVIPPNGETATEYVTDSVERTVETDEGNRTVRIAANMSDAARYHAMANTSSSRAAGMRIDVPNVSLQADTVMPESLITSIQPHVQIRHAADLPVVFTYALRVAGPLLALGVASPLLPPSWYDDVPTETILEEAWAEHRIPVFESVLNAPDGRFEKVRFPRDIGSVEEAVQRVVDDETFVPMPVERGNRFDDRFAHFCCKHGTYWRWVRPVFDGPTRASASTRLEFRPLSSQPTVSDSLAFLAAFGGLMESLPKLQHPVIDLPWETARENFYDAMRNGLESEQAWITVDGVETTDTKRVTAELLDLAAEGLRSRGVSENRTETVLAPLRHRVSEWRTPADWKLAVVENEVRTGADLGTATERMQREFLDLQAETLEAGSFTEWPAPERVKAGRN